MSQITSRHTFATGLSAFFTLAFCLLLLSRSEAQTYYAYQTDHGQDLLTKVSRNCKCPDCCRLSVVGPTRKWKQRLAMSPDGEMFGIADDLLGNTGDLYKIDTLTGNSTLVMDLHGLGLLKGLIAMGGGIFYTTEGPTTHHTDALIKIDVGANTITNIGPLFPKACGDLCVFEGEIYYPTTQDFGFFQRHIAKLDLEYPHHSTIVAFVPLTYFIVGLNASDICNTLIAVDTLGLDQLVYVNIKDGSVTPLCSRTDNLLSMASRQEFKPSAICNEIDLDCNDSSHAIGVDFKADTFDCLSPHIPIVDKDVQIYNDTLIKEVRIRLTGFVPDGALEYLDLTGILFSIIASGDGTQTIKLENGGPATAADFDFMLEKIFYQNDATYPTAGMRTIEIEFTTWLGTESEVATTFLPVNELPIYPVDLGGDLTFCFGETITLDAGSPDAHHVWSNGSMNQKINVSQSGIYSVYVHGDEACPKWDTADVTFLSVVEVSLEGDSYVCGDDDAFVYLDVNSFLPVDVIITTSDDSTLIFEEVSGFYPLDFIIDSTITFTITDVQTQFDVCIELDETILTVEKFPAYEIYIHDTICQYDSILVGFDNWVKEAGIYDNSFFTDEGCDSVVSLTLAVTPLPLAFKQTTTCDNSMAGVFTKFLANPTGCDTILETTVHYVSSDTTTNSQGTCRAADVGVITTAFTNQIGCDSIVITTYFYDPPPDTTLVFQTSCDINELGTFPSLWSDVTGCDSIVYTTVTMAPSDTTYLFSSSCDLGEVGTFQTLLNNQDGCDSLIVSNVSFSLADTTYLSDTSCDPGSLGVFETHFTSQSGCDSLVITTVTFSPHDSTSITDTSCDPNSVGVFVQTFVNQFGCDSVVTETVSLLPSSNVQISGTTCDQSSTGVFIHNLTNKYGCDSTVTETITLLPSITTSLSSTTCRSSDAGVFVSTFTAQNGCDSIVTLTVLLVPADTTTLFFKTCDPGEVGDKPNTFTNQDGCDSLVISSTSLFPLPQLDLEVTSEFNGVDISCFGESDGSITANVSGVSPLTYLWSTGSPGQSVSGLAAGNYAVTVTDGNGCETSGEVTLVQPQPFAMSFSVSNADCFNQRFGAITVVPAGGVLPIRYSIDGNNYQTSPVFDHLGKGIYTLTALDANDCAVSEIIGIHVPLTVDVSLGDNQVVSFGDTVILQALVNVPFDSLASIEWTNVNDPVCPSCPVHTIFPFVTTSFSVMVTTVDGCQDEDDVTVFIGKKTDVLVPNIFSPNGDNINDQLIISAGPEVEEISSFVIYNRWGNVVYSAEHFPANDPTHGWDGKMGEKDLNSAVFAYKLIATFKNGKSEVKAGDVTLVK